MKNSLSILIVLPLLLANTVIFANEDASLEDAVKDQQKIVDQQTSVEQEKQTAKPTEMKKKPKVKHTIFDDQMLLDGYSDKYKDLSKEILLEMIKDDTLASFKGAAAIRVFREKYGEEVVSKEKRAVEKILLRRLNRTTSPYVQVEAMYTLNFLDRYRYFKSMTPALIQKLNHYNETVNELASKYLEEIIETSNYRAREARIIFNTLRKILFLSRRRLAEIDKPGPRLSRKLKLVRWSIKVLGNQQLKKLPKEVLGLL